MRSSVSVCVNFFFLRVWCRIGFVGGLGQIQLKEQSMIEWGGFWRESLRMGIWAVYIIIITTLFFLSSSKYKDNSEFDSKEDQVGGEDSIEQVG
jgi:hypothetical protein